MHDWISETARECALGLWNEQFANPDLDALLKEVAQESRDAMTRVRQVIVDRIDSQAGMQFYAFSWGWVEEFVGSDTSETRVERICLVPEPERCRVVFGIGRHSFEEIAQGELSRGLQANIREGVCVGRTVWIELAARNEVDANMIEEFIVHLCG